MAEGMPEGNWTPIAVNHGNEKDADGKEQRFTSVILRNDENGHLMQWHTKGQWTLKQLKGEAEDG